MKHIQKTAVAAALMLSAALPLSSCSKAEKAAAPDLKALEEKAAAGDPAAANDLGEIYAGGALVPADYGAAYYWYKKGRREGLSPRDIQHRRHENHRARHRAGQEGGLPPREEGRGPRKRGREEGKARHLPRRIGGAPKSRANPSQAAETCHSCTVCPGAVSRPGPLIQTWCTAR